MELSLFYIVSEAQKNKITCLKRQIYLFYGRTPLSLRAISISGKKSGLSKPTYQKHNYYCFQHNKVKMNNFENSLPSYEGSINQINLMNFLKRLTGAISSFTEQQGTMPSGARLVVLKCPAVALG